MTEWLHFHFSLSCIGEGNGNPLRCSCLENPRDGKPCELPSMVSHRVGHNWSDLAAAVAYPVVEKAVAPYSSTLAWKIPWMVEPGRLQSMGSLRVGHDWVTSLSLFTFLHWRRKWQPTPMFLPGESQGWGSLAMGLHRVGHDWNDLAAYPVVELLGQIIWLISC